MTVDVFLGMGSNLGPRETLLVRGLTGIMGLGTICCLSSLYETEPQGGPSQPEYLNMVVQLQTTLSPDALLDALHKMEELAGRQRGVLNGPRTLDIDILLYDSLKLASPRLVIPHPRMLERRFVLEPLLEIQPTLRLPDGQALAGFLPAVLHQEVRIIQRTLTGFSPSKGD